MMWGNRTAQDEQRIRAYVQSMPAVSETVLSLSAKLRVNRRVCRGVLERMVNEGVVLRHDFHDIEPLYFRIRRGPASVEAEGMALLVEEA
jgi:ribosomal protein S25